ncbi:Rv3654c family TadE-like protein [Saccharothrix hoggarensis]|uniref:Rv3654c family TadE-like protein n=1 Tax=Saccharothrix hoggarensis TaxID=913853 RepID=A0ABW3R4K5_9PSEU
MDDRGAASVLVVAVAGVWLALLGGAALAGEAVVWRHRVVAAADLAALSAAGQLGGGVAHACARAGWVVERMGGRMDACEVDGWQVDVRVSGPPTVFGRPGARARAGPAEG